MTLRFSEPTVAAGRTFRFLMPKGFAGHDVSDEARGKGGEWTSGAGSSGKEDKPREFIQKPRLASDISGSVPLRDGKPVPVRTIKTYHVTSEEAARAILQSGFDLSKVKPRARNDLAVSTTTGSPKKALDYIGDTPGKVVLEVRAKGRFLERDDGYPQASSPQDYTNQMIKRGFDGELAGHVFIHNVAAISSIKIVARGGQEFAESDPIVATESISPPPEWQRLHVAADGEAGRMSHVVQGALNALRGMIPQTLNTEKDVDWATWERVVVEALRASYAHVVGASGTIALEHVPMQPLEQRLAAGAPPDRSRLFAEGVVDEHGHLHAPAGPGGGEFVSAAGAGATGTKHPTEFKSQAAYIEHLYQQGHSVTEIAKHVDRTPSWIHWQAKKLLGLPLTGGGKAPEQMPGVDPQPPGVLAAKAGGQHHWKKGADTGANAGAGGGEKVEPSHELAPAAPIVPAPSPTAPDAHYGKLEAGDTIQFNGSAYTEKSNPWLNQFKGKTGTVVEGQSDASPYAKVKASFDGTIANVKHVDIAPVGATAEKLTPKPVAPAVVPVAHPVAQPVPEPPGAKAVPPKAAKAPPAPKTAVAKVDAGPMPDTYHLGKLKKGDTVEITSENATHYGGHYDEDTHKYISESTSLTGKVGTVEKTKSGGKTGLGYSYVYVNVPGVMKSYETHGEYQTSVKPVGATADALQAKWEKENQPKKAGAYAPGSHVGKLAAGDIVEHEGKQYTVSLASYHPLVPSAADVDLHGHDGSILASVSQHDVKPIKVAALDDEAKMAKMSGALAGVEAAARVATGTALGETSTEGFGGVSSSKGELGSGSAQGVKDSHETRLANALRNNADWQVFAQHLDANGHLVQTYGEKSADLDYRAVSNLVQKWAGTSSKTKIADFMQQMAEKEFDLGAKLAHINLHDQATLDAEFPPHVHAGARAFLREMYVQTQKELAARGIKERVIMRRMNTSAHDAVAGDPGSYGKSARVKVDLQPMNSFSNKTSLGMFGSHQYMMKVPASRILSTSGTGYGCLNENEYVVLGGHAVPARYAYNSYDSLKHTESAVKMTGIVGGE